MFDVAAFRQIATQFRDHGQRYASLGLTSDQAARWANHGFLPDEARPWIDAGFTADDASRWADQFIGPAEALARTAAQTAR